MGDFTDQEYALARAVLQLADVGGMPDSFWQTDQRVALARYVLNIPQDGRYKCAKEWEFLYHE